MHKYYLLVCGVVLRPLESEEPCRTLSKLVGPCSTRSDKFRQGSESFDMVLEGQKLSGHRLHFLSGSPSISYGNLGFSFHRKTYVSVGRPRFPEQNICFPCCKGWPRPEITRGEPPRSQLPWGFPPCYFRPRPVQELRKP